MSKSPYNEFTERLPQNVASTEWTGLAVVNLYTAHALSCDSKRSSHSLSHLSPTTLAYCHTPAQCTDTQDDN